MSLSLTSHPVTSAGGATFNVFAGFQDTEIIFKREDQSHTGVQNDGSGNAEIQVPVDLTGSISVGDTIYVFSEGLNTNYEYDGSFVVLAIDASTITVGAPFIESGTAGYINYLKNYYVELEVVNPDNEDIDLLGFSLQDNGDAAGNININVSIVNFLNSRVLKLTSGEITTGRIKFNIRYREVYEGSNNSFTLVDTPIILIYATETPTIEDFVNDFDEPEFYLGYPNVIAFAHSDENNDGETIAVTYDELDINKLSLTTDNAVASAGNTSIGLIQFLVIDENTSVNANTKYIKIDGQFAPDPDYLPGDYTEGDYLTTGTSHPY